MTQFNPARTLSDAIVSDLNVDESQLPHAIEKDHDHEDHEPASLGVRLVILGAVVIPLAAFIAGTVYFWGRGFDIVQFSILAVMYLLTALGITVGYHRLFTHMSFKAVAPVNWFFGVAGSMAVEGPLNKWVAVHRSHHQHSDDEGDPHSPHHGHGEGLRAVVKGFWHAHVGWLFAKDQPDLERYIPDLLKNRSTVAITKLFALWVVLGLLLPAIAGGLLSWSWEGALLGFLWGGLARIFLVHHVTWSINSVCHVWGSRDYRSHDESRNNLVFGILGMGEGWHNNHHAFPTSARHGLKWWQIDFSYLLILGMKKLGLVWDVRVPDAKRMESKLAT